MKSWIAGVLVVLLSVKYGWCDDSQLPSYRLPRDVIPQHYDLQVLTHLDQHTNYTFKGIVNIQLIAKKYATSITLHSKDLTIDEEFIKVTSLDNKTQHNVVNVTYVKSDDFLVLSVDRELEQGSQYLLTIPFGGNLQESLVGFYRSSYKSSTSKEKKWIATTQFEAIYARRAFPCFDEPSMKATFTVTLGRKNGLTSISNMPLETTTDIPNMPGWEWDRFQKSVPMSTYLLAYIVFDFDYVESPKSNNNVVFKIWARAEAINQTQYASQVGPKVLSYFEEYYDVPYPLPKQDMVAIPDFNAGAMENWGIITYRETALLYSETASSSISKSRVAEVIAHELAHQWFGNLVTMKWWTDLWLNEGFATYMATLGVNHVEPEWNVLQEESALNLVEVFKLDALDNSHPVSVPIGDPSEIDQIFDVISYKKGSAIIRMMNLFLGVNVFKEGVSNYLKKYKYTNAEQDDLWQSLTDAGHKAGSLPKSYTVKVIMDSWTKQTGYPLITVQRDYSTNTANVSQVRYRSKEASQRSSEPYWWVPLSYWASDSPKPTSQSPNTWLEGVKSQSIDMPSMDHWVLFNIDMAGVYRVNYDEHNWDLLTSALSKPHHSNIGEMNRFQLITDAMALAWTKQLTYKSALTLLNYLKMEESYLPWKAALTSLGHIQRILLRSSNYGILKAYLRQILSPLYTKMGGLGNIEVSNTNKLDLIKHKILITSWACRVDVSDCRKRGENWYKEWMAESDPSINNPIPKDFRGIAYCVGVAEGGEEEWEFLWKRYIESNVASDKEKMLGGLTCSKDVWLLKRLLDTSINKDGEIRKQDSSTAFGLISGSSIGYYVARDFLYSRIHDIAKYHKGHLSILGRYLKNIASQISTRYELKQLTTWVEENKEILKDALLAVKQSLEYVSTTIDLMDDHNTNIIDSLRDLTN